MNALRLAWRTESHSTKIQDNDVSPERVEQVAQDAVKIYRLGFQPSEHFIERSLQGEPIEKIAGVLDAFKNNAAYPGASICFNPRSINIRKTRDASGELIETSSAPILLKVTDVLPDGREKSALVPVFHKVADQRPNLATLMEKTRKQPPVAVPPQLSPSRSKGSGRNRGAQKKTQPTPQPPKPTLLEELIELGQKPQDVSHHYDVDLYSDTSPLEIKQRLVKHFPIQFSEQTERLNRYPST
jgi:hypothetical protein